MIALNPLTQARNFIKNGTALAAAVQIGGSGTRLILGKVTDKTRGSKIINCQPTKGDHRDRAGLLVLADILKVIAEKAKDLDQNSIPLMLSVAGYPCKDNPGLYGNTALKDSEAVWNFANFRPQNGEANAALDKDIPKNAPERERLLNVKELPYARFAEGDKKNCFDTKIYNDTVSLATACAGNDNLQDGDSTVGLVCETGFNIGFAENYNQETSSFQSSTNTESGQEAKMS